MTSFDSFLVLFQLSAMHSAC